MKIDIDLSEIFEDGNEDGAVNASIKDLIIHTVTQRIYQKVERDISAMVSDILKKGITEKLNSYLSQLIPTLMDYEFEETATYGAKKEKTTVKNRILKELERNCTYKNERYSSDNNAFTDAIKVTVAKHINDFKPAFDKEVNALFIKEAMDYAQTKLKERLGIKA